MTLHEVFMESKEVKKLIVWRSEEFHIPLRYICREVGIEYEMFIKTYINSGSWKNCTITEEQFIKILDILGVKIKHQFIIDEEIDMYSVSKALSKKYA